ncbi:MAG TPA: hypothetical protein VFE36_14850 [Candidatus Baltobacteraceae bacterium]|nr:hypothetical protein [Candidatus Baltobacteraceae bacterium]
MSSYSEAMVGVLEDGRIFEFAAGLGKHYGLDGSQLAALGTFGKALDAFNLGLKGAVNDDEQIIKTQDWEEILALADRAWSVCQGWYEDNCDSFICADAGEE